jgi:uncharacterized membrane protein
MPLFRIVAIVFVLVLCGAVLALVLNVLRAILIVSAVALAIGVVLGLRHTRRKRRLTIQREDSRVTKRA